MSYFNDSMIGRRRDHATTITFFAAAVSGRWGLAFGSTKHANHTRSKDPIMSTRLPISLTLLAVLAHDEPV